MAQQTGTQPPGFGCNIAGCTINFSRFTDAQRHAITVHGSDRFYCHVPGCTWRGGSRKDKLKGHMDKEHSELISFPLEIPDDGSWLALSPAAHAYSQTPVGYNYSPQVQQPVPANASGASTYEAQAQASYIPVSSSATHNSQADTNLGTQWHPIHSSSSQSHYNRGDMGQYYTNPADHQDLSSTPAAGDECKRIENEDGAAETEYSQH
ncbi:hypothetical protein ONS95_007547 [Cadophora gregata]|uniref:uncharacterized protein n=1 Tax=Cadophora gregata TaxID=51156 RepID=UPI0026DC660D|nr:uncharacterized protein ONS95_007547 [Cadophora gregata]KAK0125923.1 hypothetical protein ONS95_007547 [Cadophora gregata]